MFLRAGFFAALLIGIAGSAGPASAQLFPPQQPRYVPPPDSGLPSNNLSSSDARTANWSSDI